MNGPEVWLLDANLLIALVHESHVHHGLAHRWFDLTPERRWATCALTQLAFLRLTANRKVVGADYSPSAALDVLAVMTAQPNHSYWDDAPAPVDSRELASPALSGHRRVTDVYLLGLAWLRRQRLATLDRGLHELARVLDASAAVEWISGDGPTRLSTSREIEP